MICFLVITSYIIDIFTLTIVIVIMYLLCWIDVLFYCSIEMDAYWGIILGMGSANEGRRYYVTPPLIGWAYT